MAELDVTHCGAVAQKCICDKPMGHDKAENRKEKTHECSDHVCGGAWIGDFEGDPAGTEIVRLPGMRSAIDFLFGDLDLFGR